MKSIELQCPYSYIPTTCVMVVDYPLQPGEPITISNAHDKQYIILRCAWKTFPSEIFKNHPNLNQATIHCPIQRLSASDFENAKNLTYLTLSSKKLHRINAGTFQHLKNVSSLNLAYNSIFHLEDNAFNGMSQLNDLYLQKNKLEHLNRNCFVGAPKIQSINLQSNRLNAIEDGTFDLPAVNKIILKDNQLMTLPDQLFVHAPNLEYLDLSYNRFNRFPEAICHSPSLEKLHLDHNNLTQMQISDLLRARKLNYCSLENTQIPWNQRVELVSGANDSKLIEINLKNNTLPDNILDHLSPMRNLEKISLSKCNISRINDIKRVREKFPNIRIIDLKGNAMDAKWLNASCKDLREEGIFTFRKDLEKCGLVTRDDESWALQVAAILNVVLAPGPWLAQTETFDNITASIVN